MLPKIAAALDPRGFLAVACVAAFEDAPWRPALTELVARCSTNREYRRFDVIEELSARGLFAVVGRETTPPELFVQGIDDYVESFHARNGFSRQRMPGQSSIEFDAEVRRLVRPFTVDGLLRTHVTATITWGLPQEP